MTERAARRTEPGYIDRMTKRRGGWCLVGAFVLGALGSPGCVCADLPPDTDPCSGFGCGDRTPEEDDDDSAWDDDDAIDDDDAVDDDDVGEENPCDGMDWTVSDPPTIDFGQFVGELEFNRTASCTPDGNLTQLFAGWVDRNPFAIDVLATLVDTPYPTMAELSGNTLRNEDFVHPLVLQLDVGDAPHSYEAPPSGASVHLFDFVEGVRFKACVYDHGGIWRHTGSNEAIQVPDPLLFVCDP